MLDKPESRAPANRTANHLRILLRPALLILILFTAALFRFNDLNWDQNRHLHPDERYMTVLASLLRSPGSVTAYFDSGASTLNPFNTDWGRSYVYGTLPLFAGRFFAEIMDQGCGPAPAAIPQTIGRVLFGKDAASCAPGTFTGYDYMAQLGRLWSGLADLASVFALYLIGRRLFGWRVGLLAAAFSALAVLQIQQAHFFTVDSTANLFVVLTIYFCARMVTSYVRRQKSNVRRWPSVGGRPSSVVIDGLLAGLCAGFAMASKVSIWPLAALIVLSVVVSLARNRQRGVAPLVYAVAALALAGIGTFAAFRIAQPYAFVGASDIEYKLTLQQCQVETASDILYRVCALGVRLPEPLRALFAPSYRWIQQLELAQGFVNGTIDAPFGHQWANRTPIVFPLTNLVFWGMGVCLGIAACIGLLYGMRQILRGRRWWAYLIPVVWGGLYFLYQSTQWTKSMRYLLPVYPMFCLLAATWLVAVWRYGGRRTTGDGRQLSLVRRLSSVVPIPLVLGGTLLWALAFTSIYTGPITRVAASEWVYKNVPTAVTAEWRRADSGDTQRTQLPIKEIDLQPSGSQSFLVQPENPNNDGAPYDLHLMLNHLEGSSELLVRLLDLQTNTVRQEMRQLVNADNDRLVFNGLTVDRPYQVELTNEGVEPILARTSIVANEHWDDAVPQPLPGRDAYGSHYNGLTTSSDGQIQNYAEDTPEKLPQVLDWLDEADYLALSSNRLYASIPRLPWRFPMATEYYRALFNGELGFELAADFQSFPRLGPLVFNDQEMPQSLRRASDTQGSPPGIDVPYPTAEEAFSVYDHPRVLIFKKTDDYSRARAEQVLGKYDLTRTIQQTPLQASNTPRGLLFDDQTREAQQAGGTWSELFPRSSPLNQSQPLAVLAWLLLVELVGLAAFPLIAMATARDRRQTTDDIQQTADRSSFASHPLADAGYSFAKVLGLLLVALAAWWLASAKVTMFTPAQVWAMIAALAIAGGAAWIACRKQLVNILKSSWTTIAASEVIFLIGFAAWLLVRAGNPDLWHPYMGGEKPMDFAYLNAILKSSYFPPLDPWFANGYINYYYFGYVLIGAPIKALGIDPAVAYNIVIPTLFGLTACGAFGLGASFYLSRKAREGAKEHRARRAILAGVLAAVFVIGIGNWGQRDVIFPAWQKLGGIEEGTPQLVATVNGIAKWLGGEPLPIYPNWPYWNPTRLDAALPIAEFPQFTFLYADLHAHMMTMPLAYLAIAFAIAYAAGVRKWQAVVLGAIVVGALWPTNSWDYPVYLILCLGALVIGFLSDQTRGGAARQLLRCVPTLVVFAVLTRAFYVPYLENYGAAYNSVEVWQAEHTPLKPYIIIYGVFLIPLVAYLAWGAWSVVRGAWSARHAALGGAPASSPVVGRRLVWLGAGLGALSLAAALLLAARDIPIALIALPVMTLAFLAALMPGTSGPTRVMWLLTSGAFGLTLFVELFTLRGDIGRMNTVFKFYIQAWLILGVAAPVALIWFVEKWRTKGQEVAPSVARRPSSVVRTALGLILVAAAALGLLLGLMYPAFAIPAKIGDRYTRDAPRGLDGMAYMIPTTRYEAADGKERSFPLAHDYEAIRWMQDNVKGSPTIIEGTTRGDLYRWGNRFSIYTGLPSVIGWQWHQRQQRAALDNSVVYDRDADLVDFYNTTDIGLALELIRRYNARYIVLGDLEQVYYDERGFGKFEKMVQDGYLRVAYRNPGTTIYEVNTDALSNVTAHSTYPNTAREQ